MYSTIDVQQIESLADIVSAMIGRTVQDRIPDNVLDRADQVQLVDVDPDQLMGRWRSGKLFPDQGTQSTYGYLFNIVKLNALRELAVVKIADLLKRKAVQIGGQVKNSENTVKEHILVCLSSAPSNKKVIRTAMLLTGFLPISQGLFSKHASGVPSGRWCQEQYVPDQSQEHPLQQAYTCFQAVMRQKRILRFQEL
ncbi:Sensor protein KdpD [compost metagenome]